MLKFPLVALMILTAVPAFAQVTVEAQDVGEVYQTNTTHSTIMFNNHGASAVKILSVTPQFVQDSVGKFQFPAVVAPRTSVNIPVIVSSRMDAGYRTHVFSVKTDLPKHVEYRGLVRMFSLSILDDASPKIDLGTVNTDKAPAAKTITLSSREVPDFRIERVIETPDFVTATILPDGHTVSIAGKTDAGWGRHEAYVKVALNSKVQPQAWIDVSADVHGDVIPSQNPVEMGVFRDTRLPIMVQLKSRDGSAVNLGAVSIHGIKATTTKQACVGNAQGCAQISVQVAADQPGGQVRGQLLVELPDYHRILPIDMGGLYLPESIKVHSLNEMDEKSAKASKELPPLDLKSALQQSTQAAVASPPAIPPGHGPLLKWQVSNESNVYGYMIYRGNGEDGPFLRVDKDIIRIQGTVGDGQTHSYAWRDESATAGKTYWYYIGMLKRDGSKQELSGPQKVIAK